MEFDYVVVGTGSAGSVLAARLSEDERASVLVLEAGGGDLSPWVHIPVGFVKTLNHSVLNWNFDIEPEDYTYRREMKLPRGKLLGGSSSINGMVYVRGQKADYDGWAQQGNRGWTYDDVLPYFKKTERREGGSATYRGRSGPLTISDARSPHELMDAAIRAGAELGFPANPDYNGAAQEGFAYFQVTQKGGIRQSAYRAFLKPALGRRNLELLTKALARRVVVEDGRAAAVEFERHGRIETAWARREIVLSAGAVQSPQLLELSGIGDPRVLAAAGVPVLHPLPGVGENYRDHYMTRMSWRINRRITLNERTRGLPLMLEVLRYACTRRGLLTAAPAMLAGFVRTRPELEAPDVQYHLTPASYASLRQRDLEPEPGFTIGTYQMRPESKGGIHLKSPDPKVQPSIKGEYLSVDYDREVMLEGMRIARRLMRSRALSPYVERETQPGDGDDSDEALLEFARQAGIACFHPIGTCKMGIDELAVVDPRLRVRGLRGLRVADASVMPTMPSGNTHAPTMMIAEKAADMLKADAKAG
jgi:choline dehydrogenase